MANLFRPHYTKIDRKTGETMSRQAKTWYGQYVDADGFRQRVKLTKNKTAAQQMLNELVRKEELKKAGIFNPYEQQLTRPLVDHVADWRDSLHASGATSKHVGHTVRCVERVCRACGFVLVADVSASRIEQYLAELRERGQSLTPLDPEKSVFTKAELAAMLGMKMPALTKLIGTHRLDGIGNGKARRYPRATAETLRAMRRNGQSVRTSNFALGAMKQFCNWLVLNRRIAESPLAHLSVGNVKLDRRHDRRKLDLDELRRLIDVARASAETFRGLSGIDRAMLYSLACASGFRVSELSSLHPGAFALSEEPPTVMLTAENAKNRQPAVQPLPPDVARALAVYLAGRPVDQPVWPGAWTARASEMIRRDLLAAGIPYSVDGPAGPLFADFHALRHSFIGMLDQSGATLKEAMQLARHSDPKLTMAVYGRAQLHDLAETVSRLPALFQGDSSEPQVLRATGTESLAPQLAPKVDSGEKS